MRYTCLLLIFLSCHLLHAQSVDFPLNHDAYYFMDKWQVTKQLPLRSTVKPYSRLNAANHFQNIREDTDDPVTKFNLEYLELDAVPYSDADSIRLNKSLWKGIYQHPQSFYRHSSDGLFFQFNPVWQFSVGNDTQFKDPLYINSRGVEAWGIIDDKIGFYTNFTENQARFPAYVRNVTDSVGLVPFEGFWKSIDETGMDFLRAVGYIDFNVTRHVQIQSGFGRHFIGNGTRSLLLSDFSNSYPYLKVTGDVWKIRYTNIYAQLTADVFTYAGGNLGNRSYPFKYMASHHLELQLHPAISIGLFESIIFGRADSLGGSRLKPAYLNPVIFYRMVEQQDGSADNALVGLDFKWSLWKKFMLYGQFVLDEMVVSELTSGENWWGNKYGFQAGIHAYDLILPNLDFNVEYNLVRPFTYAHESGFTNYMHYRQPLAHPMGANFKELILQLRYQPTRRLTFRSQLILAESGHNLGDGISYGNNPNLSYNLRGSEFGHELLQGNLSQLTFFQTHASYQLFHNLFLDALLIRRQEQFQQFHPVRSSTIMTFGFRWNATFRNYHF